MSCFQKGLKRTGTARRALSVRAQIPKAGFNDLWTKHSGRQSNRTIYLPSYFLFTTVEQNLKITCSLPQSFIGTLALSLLNWC